jgi:outer membrane autotransporter protein
MKNAPNSARATLTRLPALLVLAALTVTARVGVPVVALTFLPALAFAQAPLTADWSGAANDTPDGGFFGTPGNWSPAGPPSETANFSFEPHNVVTFNPNTDFTVGTLNFNTGAGHYTFVFPTETTTDVILNGAGITAAPADSPTLNVSSLHGSNDLGSLDFRNSSTDGPATINVIDTAAVIFRDTSDAGTAEIVLGNAPFNDGFQAGFVMFRDSSTAANATITALADSNIEFHDSSTAGNATLIAQGSGSEPGFIFFNETSSADHATIINNDGIVDFSHFDGGEFLGGSATAGNATITTNNLGFTLFENQSTGGNATIITNAGGMTSFYGQSTGGNATIITNAGGIFDISGLGTFPFGGGPSGTTPAMTVGSIAGAGNYFLGSQQLTVGSNNLSTTVDGVIADGGLAAPTAVGGSIVKVGTGTLTLNGVDTYTGGTTVNGGAIIVGDPTHPGAALSGGGAVLVGPGATFGGFGSVTGSVTNNGTVVAGNATPGFGTSPAGTFTIIGNLLNHGTANLASDPIVGNVLLVQGNYVGNGGTMNINTVLGSDNSPSDKLVISLGTGTGNTSVHVTNAGGPGAETVSNGILVVQAINGATTAPGAFGLAGAVRAGDIDYDLYRGGINGSDPNDWFLRSEIVVLPPVVPPEPPGVLPPLPITPINPLPTDPPPQPLPPGIWPIIGPELATDGVVQPIARQMGFTMLGTLHERIGDTLTSENADPFAEGWGQSGWVRFFGQQIDNKYVSFPDPSANGRLFGVQAGFDILRASFMPGHRDAAGVYFAYGNSAMDVTGLVTNPTATAYMFTRTGTVNLYGYSGGAYWTHYGPGGWYLDAVLQGTVYNGNSTTQFANLPTDGSGIITSLEAGYPIPLSFGPRFILEPQGQILWQHTSFRQAYDGLGEVGLGSTSGATGRLGLRAQSTIVTQNGQVWQPYVRANLWQNWGGSATTSFAGYGVPLLQQSTQLEFAAGLTYKFSPLLSFYTQAGYEFAVGGDTDGGKRQGVKGDIGLRLTFGAPPPLPPALVPAVAPAPAAVRSYLVFFDWDKATLTDRAREIIREAAHNSTQVQYTRIDVNGYTDTSGTPRYNQGLSMRRAQAVAGELVRDGVPAGAISIQGFGETHLLVPTGAGVREPQNRRVEIILN